MDPTTVLPPSPEKSPPPQNQNPYTATVTTIDAFAGDRHQKYQPITSRNMDNFRALVMKLAGRLLPAHKSLIGRRFDDIFPDELLAPDHPPYADMILIALWELNAKGGSSEAAISDFIQKEYHELPWAHATILNHHLRDLCMKGKIVMTSDRCYLRCSSITKPLPSPCQNLCLDDDSSCSSPISSPYSSSSASLCSSSSSSSSSFCVGPPYQRRKRRLKRKRKNIKDTGCKTGRGRGRGRQPRTIQVGHRGRSLAVIRARQHGRLGKDVKIGEKTLMEEEQVDDLVENVSKLEKPEQYQPPKQYNVTWIGRGEHIQGKGECVKQKQSGSKQHVSKEPFQQLEEGTKKQGHQRKQYNVVWIGRGVRKLKEAGKDLLETECDEKVIELEDYASEDAEMINCDAEVEDELKTTKVGYNRPEENQQPHIVEKQFLDKEHLTSLTDDKILPWEPNKRVDIEAELEVAEKLQLKHQLCDEVLPDTLQEDDKVKEDQYLLTTRSEGEEGIIKECCGKQKQVEGESTEQIGSQLQQNDHNVEQIDLQKQRKEETDGKFHTQGQLQRGSIEQDQLQKQEDRLGDEQDSMMMQCGAQVTDASVEKQPDDTNEEQIRPEQQLKKGEEECETHEQQNDGGAEQKMLEIQVQMVGKPLQDEEIQKGRVLIDEERDAMMTESEMQARVETVEKTEPEEHHDCLTEEQVDTKEQSKEHDDATEEPINPQEKCIERTEEDSQSCGPDFLKNGEAKSDAEQPTEVNQKEIGLAMDSEVHQDLGMNQGGAEVGMACVSQNESEERQHVAEKHVQPQEHYMGGNEFQLHKQQQRDPMEQVQVEGEVEVAKDEHRQKQLNEVKEKDIGLMQGVSNCLQDLVMAQAEAEVEGDSEQHIRSEVYQDQLEKQETVTSQVQPQQEGQHKKVFQGESELTNNLTAVKQDLLMIESGSQLERTSVEHNELPEDDTVVGQVQPQKQLIEGTKEGQKDENEAGFENNQSEECENGVMVQSYQPQEQCVERIEERIQPCIQQTEASKKDEHQEKDNAASNENLASSSSAVDVSGFSCKSLGVAEVNLPDDKHQDKQRRPLRQGLRSSCKKEETTTKTKNHLERVTPVRRSLRPRKTVSEATVVIKNGPDRSKDQLKHSTRVRPSKRKPGIAEAEQVSKSQKTRKADL